MFQLGFLLSNPALFKVIYTILSVTAGSSLPVGTVIGLLSNLEGIDSRLLNVETKLFSNKMEDVRADSSLPIAFVSGMYSLVRSVDRRLLVLEKKLNDL